MILAGDIAECDFFCAFSDDEAHGAIAVGGGDDVGHEALGDGIVWFENGFGDDITGIGLRNISEVGAFGFL